MRINLITSIATLAFAPAVLAQDHRELGPHEHGHGTLNVAIDGKVVAMELLVPGMDIVGFEHKATTADQKAALERGKAELAKPFELFKIPAAANCGAADAKVLLEAEHGQGHEHGGAKDEPAKAEDDDHDGSKDRDDASHDNDKHEGHSEFNVTYDFTCEVPAKFTSITFDYFKTFAGASKLTVNVVSANVQTTYEASRAKPVVNLTGVM
jgi:hypothetical protein